VVSVIVRAAYGDEQHPGAILDTTAEPKQIEVKQKTGALPKWWREKQELLTPGGA
jgi:hypothetical protein